MLLLQLAQQQARSNTARQYFDQKAGITPPLIKECMQIRLEKSMCQQSPSDIPKPCMLLQLLWA